ncbi:pantoate--beta-alanine ligase [Treponema sp. JC4]|uniref:pantoate--beta-alanine ligase n=1 Tax=Treponema sp. JC4 TaxID=1124982 RepID=UPI00025B0D39|nr:pantoate--beta-alanine ligase [Treponema sp. JC4]EID86055.1 pantoate--beta-alanine ligase [Treponema sp. JC4]
MKIIKTVEEFKEIRKTFGDKSVGFVPTMGGLHKGHLSLMKRAIAENDISVASVYLNPTQFNDKKDLETYPANFADDCALLEKAGVDYLFAPTYPVMYPDDYAYMLTEKRFSKELCGAKRPGHFDGVLTVVMKFFNIVRPTRAYFGEKDFQQYKLLDGMVKAFFMDIELIPCPIVREDNGLAISSRNRKLSPAGLALAPKFHEILAGGGSEEEIAAKLEAAGFKVDYVTKKDDRLYAAVFLEEVRLIDNVAI